MTRKKRLIYLCFGIAISCAAFVFFLNGEYTDTPPEAIKSKMILRGEMEYLEFGIKEYHRIIGEYPPLENADAIRALLGKNPINRQFLDQHYLKLNKFGEAIDSDGNQFLFVQIGGDIKVIQQKPD